MGNSNTEAAIGPWNCINGKPVPWGSKTIT